MPSTLAEKIRRRFAYAIDMNSDKFMPVFSAATVLHPEFCAYLPKKFFDVGKEEIDKWIKRLPPKASTQPASTPARQLSMFSRLSSQFATNHTRATTRFVTTFFFLIF